MTTYVYVYVVYTICIRHIAADTYQFICGEDEREVGCGTFHFLMNLCKSRTAVFLHTGYWRTVASCGRKSAGQPRTMVSWGTRWFYGVKTTLTRRSKSQQRRYGT